MTLRQPDISRFQESYLQSFAILQMTAHAEMRAYVNKFRSKNDSCLGVHVKKRVLGERLPPYSY